MHNDLAEDTFVATNRKLKGYTKMKSKSKYHKIIMKIKEDRSLV